MGKQEFAMSRQLALPLGPAAEPDSALEHAWSRSRLRLPLEVAMHVPALAICLRNVAAAEKRRAIRRTLRAQLPSKVRRWMKTERE